MTKITDIFKQKAQTFSIEIFPPKTPEGEKNLEGTLSDLAQLKPDFVSVTYGAGGGSRDTTLKIVRRVQEQHGLVALHHFTCVIHTRREIKAILDHLRELKVDNILALRGDPPKDRPDWTPGDENFRYSSELVRFIHESYDGFFSIGVAGFPEKHPLAPSREFDREILRAKIRAGAEYVITQLFFDNQEYFNYVKQLKSLGVNCRVIPGILPITNFEGAVRFCQGCGASIPENVRRIFEPLAEDRDATLKAGTEFAIRQCRELLDGGAPGVHLYTLNRTEPVRTILRSLQTTV